MTAKEKAKELIEKYMPYTDIAGDAALNIEAKRINKNAAKQCALTTVDEILYNVLILADERKVYWQQVKEEIEKL